MNPLFDYILRLGDNALILGQRLSEWCGHAPELELDIALTNIALDHIGHTRLLFQYAAELEGKGRDEDDIAYLRDAWEFKNVLLVEQPNDDFAHTIVRSFLFDVHNYLFYKELQKSSNAQLSAIAEKVSKELHYHLRFSTDWMIRLGDGTDESHQRMQEALDDLWMYRTELHTPNETDRQLAEAGVGVDLERILPLYDAKVAEVIQEATLSIPTDPSRQYGGKDGKHTEHLGHLLAELQWMQRAYPNMEW